MAQGGIAGFTAAIGPASGSAPTIEISSFDAFKTSESLDSGCDLQFAISGRDDAAASLDELATDVWLYRDGVLRQRFRVIQIGQAWGPSGEDEIAVTAVCYKRLLASRILISPPAFSSTPQDEIVWGLIQNVQAQSGGDYGITYPQPGGPSAILRDRNEYESGDNAGDRLADLSAVIDGPWWGINGSLELVVSAWDAFATQGTPIQLGATARALERESAAAEFANAVFVDGDDAATIPEIRTTVDIGTDPRGRWDKTASFSSVTRQQTLSDHADAFLQQSLFPAAEWRAEIEPERWLLDADYGMGEFADIVVPPTTAAPLGQPATVIPVQIMTVELTASADGAVEVALAAVEAL